MATALIRKGFTKNIVWVFLSVLLVGFALCGCDGMAGRYPTKPGTKWICTDPHFFLTYSEDENGNLIQTEQLEWDGKVVEVDIGFISTTFCVYPENSDHYDDRLFSGTWYYRNGDLVLGIDEDFIFGNQYSELVFSPTDFVQG